MDVELADRHESSNPMHEITSQTKECPKSMFEKWEKSIISRVDPSTHAPAYLLFVDDWAHAWNSLCDLQPNEMAHQDPLLYICIFIAFHKKTWNFNIALTTYVVLAHVIFTIVYPGGNFLSQIVSLVGTIVSLLFGSIVVKGSFEVESIAQKRFGFADCSDVDIESNRSSVSCEGKKDSIVRSMFLRGSPSISAALRAFLQLAISGCCSAHYKTEDTHKPNFTLKVRRDGKITCGGYYYVAECMWKYLIDTASTSVSTMYHVSPVDRQKEGQSDTHPDPKDRIEPWKCDPFARRVMFFGVLFSIAYALFLVTVRWSDFLMICPDSEKSFCKREQWVIIFTLGYALDGLQNAFMIFNFFAMWAMFACATNITNSLVEAFALRFSPLRKLTVADVSGDTEEEREALRAIIQTDAEERYMFMRHYQSTASTLWEFLLSVSVTSSAGIAVLAYISIQFMLQKYDYIDPILTVYFIVSISIVLFVVVLLAEVNTASRKLSAMFISSAVDDYSIIGGREQWLGFIESAPVDWKMMGFTFTWTWVGSIALTTGTSLLAMFASSFIPGFS
jgi:hypothetical protein